MACAIFVFFGGHMSIMIMVSSVFSGGGKYFMKKEIGTTTVLVWGLLAVLSFGAGGCGTEGEGQKESMPQAGQRKTCDQIGRAHV